MASLSRSRISASDELADPERPNLGRHPIRGRRGTHLLCGFLWGVGRAERSWSTLVESHRAALLTELGWKLGRHSTNV